MNLKPGPILALAILAGSSPVAQAQAVAAIPPGFETVFSGALVSTYEDGRIGKLWLAPGGDFVGQSRTGRRNAGKWSLDQGRVCMRQTRPIPLPFHYCTPLPASLAMPWPAKAPTGERVVVRFAPGDRP